MFDECSAHTVAYLSDIAFLAAELAYRSQPVMFLALHKISLISVHSSHLSRLKLTRTTSSYL